MQPVGGSPGAALFNSLLLVRKPTLRRWRDR
jgi:hypothetical protein